MNRTILSILAFLSLAGYAAAAGTTGADVMTIRPGARAAALGETYATLGDDLYAPYFNPAGLNDLKGVDLSFLHWAGIAETAYEAFGYAQALSFGSLGLSVLYRHLPDISNAGAQDSPISSNDVLVTATYAALPARFLPEGMPDALRNLKAGVNLKFLRSHLGSVDTATGALDLGARLPLSEGLTGGLTIQNLGPPIKYINVSDPLPVEALASLCQTFHFSQNSSLSGSLDLEQPLDGTSRLHLGAEVFLVGALALRVGYIVEDQKSLGGLTAGAGFWLDQSPLLFKLDYAFRPAYYNGFNSFEPQHMLSLGLDF